MPLRDASADLLLGGRCVGCGLGGRVLCPACSDLLPVSGVCSWPSPTPAGLVPPYACGVYAGLLRDLVIGHKERGLLGLRPTLSALLAAAVGEALVGEQVTGGPVLLVPVPSRPATVRARGQDATYAMTAGAARLMRIAGLDVEAHRLLRSRPGVLDQSGLGAQARRDNLAGSMAVRPDAVRRLAGRRPRAHVVVCDDVLTTGSTAREAQRALEAVGVTVLAVAAVAATVRRGAREVLHGETSGSVLSSSAGNH